MTAGAEGLDERFAGDDLDRAVWLPHYLPHWSSREASAAAYTVADGALRLEVPPDHPRWCPDRHPEPLRVSCLQSGSWSGPVGSTRGPQPFAEGLTVRSEEPTWWGCTPTYGEVGIRMRGEVGPRSMVAFWLSGIEDRPERSAEICVAEIFGRDLRDGRTVVGMGVHAFRNPDVAEDFTTVPLDLDVGELHDYAVDWRPDGIDFLVDGEVVRRSAQSPDHPVQLMVGVFDFPDWPGDDVPVPGLTATRVWWSPR